MLNLVIRLVMKVEKNLFGNKGSVTIEAAAIFPIFLAFMLLLINFINVATVYVAMDHAVSETLKQIAAHSYPLKYLKSTSKENRFAEVMNSLGSLDAESKDITTSLKSDIINEIGNQIKEKGTEYALNTGIKLVAQKKIKELYPLGNITNNDFTITRIKMYNPNNASGSGGDINGIQLNNTDLVITVEYKVNLPVPFFPVRQISLSNSAVERAWVDN